MSEKSKKEPGTKKAADMAELQRQSQKLLRGTLKGFKATWTLYKSSKTGLIGLGIVVGFLVMAIFAPFIAPYGPDFTAPSIDIFIADNQMRYLEHELNWSEPMGLTEASVEQRLTRIMVYSSEGVTIVYPVTSGTSPTTGEPGIIVGQRETLYLPPNADHIEYSHFVRSILFILVNETLHEYSYENLVDLDINWDLGYEPKYMSNIWNAYSTRLRDGRLAIAFADDHNLTLVSKRPPTPSDATVKTYISTVTIEDATIVSDPLVVDGYYTNGSMVIVPTDAGLMAYDMNIVRSNLTGYVTNVSIGPQKWTEPYEIPVQDPPGSPVQWVPFEPVISDNMITFPNPGDPTGEDGETVIVLASTDGTVIGYDRENGTVMFANKLVTPTVRSYTITDLYPSPGGVILVGTSGERGFIAGIDPANGRIKYNNTQYTTIDGHVNSVPQYLPGMWTFLLSTDADRIYLLSELLKVNATFSAPGGGSASPVAYLGNIYISSIVGGNYFGVITQNNSIFVETLSGVNIAPLPPGTYPSGNNYVLGTDYEGHDILAWLVYGTRAELLIGTTAAFFAVVIGTIVGLVAGFYSGMIDDILMRATDVVLSLPGLVIILLFAAVFGPSLMNIIIIIAILSWAGIARVIRSVTLSLKERAFVDAAIIAGASDARLIFRHIAPNVLPYAFLYMTFNISGAIVTEAILAFLGFGDVTSVTWGMMLQFLQISGHSLDAPWWLLPPGIAITLLSLAFYLIGRAFDEVVNPRLRKR